MKKLDNNKKKMILWAVIIIGVLIAAYFLWKSNSGGDSGASTPAPGELETMETTARQDGSSDTGTTEKQTDLPTEKPTEARDTTAEPFVVESETYSDKEHVAAYLNEFGHLPANYISKNKADNTPNWQKNGYYIGGDRFGNYEGRLPKKSGRTYYECDLSYSNNNIKKGNRGTKRLVYSNDGLIFYTEDHYESFTQLYP